MSERDELIELILDHFHEGATAGSSWRLSPGGAADAILAAGYVKPRWKQLFGTLSALCWRRAPETGGQWEMKCPRK